MALLLTGYILQSISLCERRGLLEASQPSQAKPRPGGPRRLLSIVAGSCGRKHCAHRERLEGEAYGLPYVASPDLLLTTPDGRLVAVVKATTTRARSPMRTYYARLLLEAYAASLALGGEPLLAVLQAPSEAGLLRGARFMLDEWSPGPYAGEGFMVHTRVYDRAEAERIISRAASVLLGLSEPRARPGAACSYCPFRAECPYAAKE